MDLCHRPYVVILLDYCSYRKLRIPAGIWCQNDVDVVSTSMRRHHVASTLIRCHVTSCARWDVPANAVHTNERRL